MKKLQKLILEYRDIIESSSDFLNQKIKLEKSTMGKKKRQNSTKELEQGEKLMEELGLSKSEKNFIYDLIEEDFEE